MSSEHKEKNILVVDIGTQSLRASIINDLGEIKIMEIRKYENPYFSPKNGYVEQYPQFYFDVLKDATKTIRVLETHQLFWMKIMM